MDINEIIVKSINSYDIEAILRESVNDIVLDIVSKDVREQIKLKVKESINIIISEEISKVLAGEIHTDDGWGRKESYVSFEMLFKKSFREKLNDSWDMKKTIENHIKQYTEKLFKDSYQDVANKMAEVLLKK